MNAIAAFDNWLSRQPMLTQLAVQSAINSVLVVGFYLIFVRA